MLRDVALGTELPRAGKSLPRRVLLQEQEDECRDEQDGDGEHAERGVAGQGRGGGHQEGADDRGGLAEDIVEAVVLVGVILGDELLAFLLFIKFISQLLKLSNAGLVVKTADNVLRSLP